MVFPIILCFFALPYGPRPNACPSQNTLVVRPPQIHAFPLTAAVQQKTKHQPKASKHTACLVNNTALPGFCPLAKLTYKQQF